MTFVHVLFSILQVFFVVVVFYFTHTRSWCCCGGVELLIGQVCLTFCSSTTACLPHACSLPACGTATMSLAILNHAISMLAYMIIIYGVFQPWKLLNFAALLGEQLSYLGGGQEEGRGCGGQCKTSMKTGLVMNVNSCSLAIFQRKYHDKYLLKCRNTHASYLYRNNFIEMRLCGVN